MTTLYSREFPLDQTLRIWDSLFADPQRFELAHCLGVAILEHADLTSTTLDFSDTMHRLQQCALPPAETILIGANHFRYMEFRRVMDERNGARPDGPKGQANRQTRPVSPTRRRLTALSQFASSAANAISILHRDIIDSMESVDPMEEMRRRTPRSPRSPNTKSIRTPQTPMTPTPPTPNNLSTAEIASASASEDIPTSELVSNPSTPTNNLAE